MEGFHKRLNYLIEESSLSKAELARKIDISLPTLYTYINGRSTPSLETISKIAAAFDVSVDWLVGASDQRKRNLFEIDFTDPKEDAIKLLEQRKRVHRDDWEHRLNRIEKLAQGLIEEIEESRNRRYIRTTEILNIIREIEQQISAGDQDEVAALALQSVINDLKEMEKVARGEEV